MFFPSLIHNVDAEGGVAARCILLRVVALLEEWERTTNCTLRCENHPIYY